MPQLSEQNFPTDKPIITEPIKVQSINDPNETRITPNFIGDPTITVTPYVIHHHSIPDSTESNSANTETANANLDGSPDHLKNKTLTRQRGIRRSHRYSTVSTKRFSNVSNNRISITTQTQKECQVCTDTFDYQRFVPVSSECAHENNICIDCIRMHIKVQVSDKGNTLIRCPSFECHGVMQEWDVKRFATSEDFERYQKLLVNSTLSQIKDFRWCSNPKCNSGQIHEDGYAAPIMTCNACHQKSCVIHDLPIHPGQSCSRCQPIDAVGLEVEEKAQSTIKKTQKTLVKLLQKCEATRAKPEEKARRKEAARQEKIRKDEIRSERLIKSQTKQCPNCNRNIQKVSGCDHMRCTIGCQHEFCWLCLADYDPIRKEGNHRHMTTCSHYRVYS